MRRVLGLVHALATFLFLGALVYAGFSAVAVSAEFGDGTMDTGKSLRPALILSGAAFIIMVLSGTLRKRV